ncbi:MAG TPA: IgGFc-binding protein [Myxococcota bacterium]|jgi:hypothetical protein|nr:IgGFc-binding protein [Myxococcota bacterium]
MGTTRAGALLAAAALLGPGAVGCFGWPPRGVSACPPGTQRDDAGACGPISCSPGTQRCAAAVPGDIEQCRSSGDGWITVGRCAPGQACTAAPPGVACDPPECTPGEDACTADGLWRVCLAGAYQAPVPCAAALACDPAAGGCVPTVCGPSTTFCADDHTVAACNALGTGSTVVETCPADGACAAGGCFTMCDLVELTRSFYGCRYYAVDLDNASHDDGLQFDVVAANPSDTYASLVTIEARDPAGGWALVASDTVAPRDQHVFPLADRHAEGTALAALAYRVTSSTPIAAYQINSDGTGAAAASSGATMLFPAPALGGAYYVVSLPTAVGDDAVIGFGGEVHHSGFAVAAAFDATYVTVVTSTPTLAGPGVPALLVGEALGTPLAEGDVLQIEAAAVGGDLTGSYVASDQPVAVFGYNECAVLGPGSCDHVEEELLPMESWGFTFAAARGATGAESEMWRLLAAENATTVTFHYGPGVSGLPASDSSLVLDAGVWVDFVVDGPASPGDALPGDLGDFVVWADKPIFLADFRLDEPDFTTVVPRESWSPEYAFPAPGFFAEDLTVVGAPSVFLQVDGAAVPDAAWETGPGLYKVFRTPLAAGAHTLAGSSPSELDAYVTGHLTGGAGSASYGFIVGLERMPTGCTL